MPSSSSLRERAIDALQFSQLALPGGSAPGSKETGIPQRPVGGRHHPKRTSVECFLLVHLGWTARGLGT